jgi:hypothetical protein
MATDLNTLLSRLRDRLGLSKFAELKVDYGSSGETWDSSSGLTLPLSDDANTGTDTIPSSWESPDVVEAILERARFLYITYRGDASQVDAQLGQFFDKETKQHDSAPRVFDR